MKRGAVVLKMLNYSYVTVLIALALVVCFTVLYVRTLLRGKGFLRSTWAWVKNVIDSLWGIS